MTVDELKLLHRRIGGTASVENKALYNAEREHVRVWLVGELSLCDDGIFYVTGADASFVAFREPHIDKVEQKEDGRIHIVLNN